MTNAGPVLRVVDLTVDDVTVDDVLKVVSRASGIPLERLSVAEKEKLLNLEDGYE